MELSANPYLHEEIIENAKRGMDNLLDYIRSDEYRDIYQKSRDAHPKARDDDKNEKKQPAKAASTKKAPKKDDDEDEKGGDDDWKGKDR